MSVDYELVFYSIKEKQPVDNISQASTVSLKGETRLSLEQFRQLLQEHLLSITQTQQNLQKVCIPFKGRGDIRPIHCRSALMSLEKMSGHIEELGEILNQTAYLPLVITALRYQFLFVLHRVEKQASRLEELLNDYLVLCFTPSSRMQRIRKEIDDTSGKLLQQIADIVDGSKLLNDEARFEEKKLALLFEKQ